MFEKDNRYFDYPVPQEGADPLTLDMLEYARMPGICKPERGKTAEGTVLRFPTEGNCTFAEAAQMHLPGFAGKMLLGLCDAMISVEAFMLDPDALVTGEEGILWNIGEQKAEFLVLPGRTVPKQTAKERLQDFCTLLWRTESSLCDRICTVFAAETLLSGPVDWKLFRKKVEKLPRESASPALIRAADGKIFPLRPGKTVVGRSDENAVLHISDHPSVSRTHASLDNRGGKWEIVDLSLNHTCVNGTNLQKGTPAALCAGDALYLATEKYRFVC